MDPPGGGGGPPLSLNKPQAFRSRVMLGFALQLVGWIKTGGCGGGDSSEGKIARKMGDKSIPEESGA